MRSLQRQLSTPWDIAGLAIFRIFFGAMMAFSSLRFIWKGWVHEFYINPTFHFTYTGFDWLKPLPANGMYLVFGLMILAACAICLGFFYRIAAAGFFLLFTYVELLDKTFYLNHYVFVSLVAFLLIWMPANRYWSLDVFLGRIEKQSTAPAWCLISLRLQIGLLYVFAGIAKLEPDWLLQAQPLRIWLQASADTPLIGHTFDWPITALIMSWAGMIYDLTIPFWLSWRPARPFAYATVVLFHGMTAMLFPIGVFPWVMMVASSAFFAPSWPRRFIPQYEPTRTNPQTHVPLLLKATLTIFFVLQVMIPFRYLAYDGNVLWHERGFRFSWRVMLVEKTGHAEFTVVDGHDQKSKRVDLKQWLTPQQEKMMSTQPDMLLQFAKAIKQDFVEKGWSDPKVYANVWVSLNGRPRQQFINPQIDLTRQTLWPGAVDWILPGP